MQFAPSGQRIWSRRTFLRDTTTAFLGLASCGFLTSCGQSGYADIRSVSATISGAPTDDNPTSQKQFLDAVREFEQLHPNEHIVGSNYTFDPSNYYIRLAAGQAEDAFNVYLSEPQFLIEQHAITDITDLLKGWQYFDSIAPNFLQIVTAPGTQRIYGIPLGGYALGLLYNRKLFQQAGLDPDKPPTTWNDLQGYAKQLTRVNVAGFAELSGANQGGWHFANWVYSTGGNLQRRQGGRWMAVFNKEGGLQVLQQLQSMRFTDQSIVTQPLQSVGDILALMAKDEVAMAIMAPDAFSALKGQYNANLGDFGLGPMPQNTSGTMLSAGPGTLAGGNAWVFNPKSSPDVIRTAFDWILFSNFDLHLLEEQYKRKASLGLSMSNIPDPVFIGAFQQKLSSLAAKYTNAATYNYRPFAQAMLHLPTRAEPLIETQTMYHILDIVMRSILTDSTADPQVLLDKAATSFQHVLDNVVPTS